MSNRDEFESHLQEQFAKLRAGDGRSVPDFARMIAAVESASDASLPSPEARTASSGGRWRRLRYIAVAGPMLAAAGLGAVWFSPGRRADREFDRTVTEWAVTSRQAIHSPTDGLLAVPGSEYLRSVPAIGRGVGDLRRGS